MTSDSAEHDSALPPYVVPHSQESIRVLHRDDHLLIVDKPHLLLSVPGRHPINHDSMLGRLQRYDPGVNAVHRLDLDTSGLLVVPKHREALAELSRSFQRRQVHKVYTALVWGQVPRDHGVIELPIISDWHNRPLQKVCALTGKPSTTRYQVTARSPHRTLLRLQPITGRSHQLRIHLRELGHPILGCDMYAHEEAFTAAPRLLLHATRLGFPHPLTGEWLSAYSPAPFSINGLLPIRPG